MAQHISNFRTVSIPTELLEKVEKKIRQKKTTFHTKSDLITYAIRKYLEDNHV